MAKQNINSKKGFTIIEVVLVLAIAGLIFLMVFVALPALQRSQRDTQRRNDIARVSTALTNYQTNHSYSSKDTTLPDPYVDATGSTTAKTQVEWKAETEFSDSCNEACEFIRDYMNSGVATDTSKSNTFEDPSGNPYNLVISQNIKLHGVANLSSPTTTTESGSTEETAKETLVYTGDVGTLSSGKNAFESYTIFMVPGGMCDGSDVKVSAKNDYAILYRLEGSGVYCIDNQ